MSYAKSEQWTIASEASVDARADFIAKTYLHLGGAVLALIAIEAMLLTVFENQAIEIFRLMAGSRFSWLVVLGIFMAVSWVAHSWASSATSLSLQYMGLGLYVVAEAFILLPLLIVATKLYPGQHLVETAGIITGTTFTGLTGIVFITRRNFSFLGPALSIAGFVALGFIVCSMIFGFNLGILFTVAMVGLCCGYILYDTSNVLHEYRIGQHVAASLALFASVVMLFWYILQLLMKLQSRD